MLKLWPATKPHVIVFAPILVQKNSIVVIYVKESVVTLVNVMRKYKNCYLVATKLQGIVEKNFQSHAMKLLKQNAFKIILTTENVLNQAKDVIIYVGVH